MQQRSEKRLPGIAVIGCGYWGPNLVRNFNALPDCTLRKMCDTSEERLQHLRKLYPGVETTKNYQRVLEDPTVDGVAIATPVKQHHAMAKAALLAGKHVLVEKPMALSAAECQDLIQTAQRAGRVLMVGHTFRFSPAVRRIKELIESGDMGTVRYISARRLNLGLFQRDLNVAWDLAPHDISIALYLIGEPPSTVTCTGNAHVTPGVEDVTSMCLQFSNNTSVLIHSSWLDPRKTREMTVVGSKKMVVYDDVSPREKIRIFDVRVEAPPHYDTFAEFHFAYHYGDVHIPYVRDEEPLKIECSHFLDCMEKGQTPLTSGAEGLSVVRILEAATASLRLGGAPMPVQPVILGGAGVSETTQSAKSVIAAA